MVGAVDPYWGSLHCARTSQCLSSPRCINGYWLCGFAAEATSKGALLIFFTIAPNALEPSTTRLKGPYSATPLFLFIYESFAIIIYSAHVEANEITVK